MIPIFDLLLITVISLAIGWDLALRKIPNWLILIGLTSAILLNAMQGFGALSQSILGMLVGIALLTIPFALGWLGAGDVKCFGVMCGFLGVGWLPRIAFYTILTAGAIAIAYALLNRFNVQIAKKMWTDLRVALFSFGRILPEPVGTTVDRTGHSVPWAVAIGAGTIIAYYFDPRGQWAGF